MKKESRFLSVKPSDIIMRDGRVWKVTGVYLGASEQENVIGLRCADVSMPCVPDGRGGVSVADEMFVPLALIDPRDVFRRVDHEVERKPKAVA